ncbi:MAG: DNA polymerase IV [Bacteroidota bacterium]|nr:DNA polymerase IV [Bacteroidota bacterium]
MPERTILHLDLDSFFVSVERLLNSELMGKPVIIGGTSDRGVVASCSYEARAFGVHSAMPIRTAKRLCPHGIYVRNNMEEYSRYSRIVTKILEERAPLVEKASVDEHYLDITGMDKYVMQSSKWAHELRMHIIKETGLPLSYGMSVNKTVSKIATSESKPNGEKVIEPGTEKMFLAPLSVKKIPMIGEKTYEVLRGMGIEFVAQIQSLSLEKMQKAMGEHGISIWRKANGIDDNPVEPYSERKSISSENTYHTDTTDVLQLRRSIVTMVDQLAYQLRKEKKVCGCVAIKLRHSDFSTYTFQAKIPYTAADHVLLEKALHLFTKNYSPRVLIRLIGVRFSHIVSGFNQIDLFNDTEEKIKLYQAMDKIRDKFGDNAIMKSISLPTKKDPED